MNDRYIFRYIIILVLIVSVLLSGAAMLLKPYQDNNKKNEQRINILKAAGITGVDKNNAEQLFEQHCTTTNDGDLPYYIIDDKTTVIPMQGNGLWGPIWGYIGLSEDFQTIVGAVFDHKSETPGLGAEITTDNFQSQFSGKEMKRNGDNITVEVDAIAGATRTSDGVKDMIKNTLEAYKAYFEGNE
ncbi:MAG: FMN-binding protein [Bacteroidales bacterium]|nr:FMN-binding protein [Bacteroidales bacterium]